MFIKIIYNNKSKKLALTEEYNNIDKIKEISKNFCEKNINDIVIYSKDFENQDIFLNEAENLEYIIESTKCQNKKFVEIFIKDINENLEFAESLIINEKEFENSKSFMKNSFVNPFGNEDLNKNEIINEEFNNNKMNFTKKNHNEVLLIKDPQDNINKEIKKELISEDYSEFENISSNLNIKTTNFENDDKKFIEKDNNMYDNINSNNNFIKKTPSEIIIENNLSKTPLLNEEKEKTTINLDTIDIFNTNNFVEPNEVSNIEIIKNTIMNELREELKLEIKNDIQKNIEEIQNSFVNFNQSQSIINTNNTNMYKDSNWLHNVKCEICQNQVIGIRYLCLYCPNYNLCETCENKNHHLHDFIKIKSVNNFNYENLSNYYVNYVLKNINYPTKEVNDLKLENSNLKNKIEYLVNDYKLFQDEIKSLKIQNINSEKKLTDNKNKEYEFNKIIEDLQNKLIINQLNTENIEKIKEKEINDLILKNKEEINKINQFNKNKIIEDKSQWENFQQFQNDIQKQNNNDKIIKEENEIRLRKIAEENEMKMRMEENNKIRLRKIAEENEMKIWMEEENNKIILRKIAEENEMKMRMNEENDRKILEENDRKIIEEKIENEKIYNDKLDLLKAFLPNKTEEFYMQYINFNKDLNLSQFYDRISSDFKLN